MDVVTLSRIQFGVTTALHFLFVPLTLGMVWFVAIFQTLHYRTGEERYRRMAKFWGKLFLVNFGMGVVTGLVQEFQFGMNWSEYSRFVGDIFGALLAIETMVAFFLEAVFIGIWIFGESLQTCALILHLDGRHRQPFLIDLDSARQRMDA